MTQSVNPRLPPNHVGDGRIRPLKRHAPASLQRTALRFEIASTGGPDTHSNVRTGCFLTRDRAAVAIRRENTHMEPLQSREMVWSVLLTRWIDVARSSLAFPEHPESEAWRRSIVPMIELQAVIFALNDLSSVDPADRPFCRDRAGVLTERAARRLEEAWGTMPLPDMLLELLSDATLALDASVFACATELTWPGPGAMRVPDLPDLIAPDAPAAGSLLVMAPGTIAFPDQPVLWWTGPDRPRLCAALPQLLVQTTDHPSQVYRQLAEDGTFLRDIKAFVLDAPPPGMPLLVPLLEEGRRVGQFLHPADIWYEMQIRAGVPAPDV